MPLLSVGALPTANGARRAARAVLATTSGGKQKITRIVPSNLMVELKRNKAP
jgi:hypothetical protein